MSQLELCGLSVEPCEKKRGFLTVPGDHDPRFNPSLCIINGRHPGKTVVVLGGTHGTEYSSIEAVIRIIKELDPNEMRGTVIAVPILNLAQFEERTQFINPLDDLNLNSVFPGSEYGSFTERLAYSLFKEIVSKSDALVDCHGGDINEDLRGFVVASDSGDAKLNQTSLEMSSCFDTSLVHVFPSTVPGMTNSAQKIYGIPCIQPEAGTPFPVTEEDIMFHFEGILNVLRYFGVLEGEPAVYDQLVSPDRLKLFSEYYGVWDCDVELNQMVKEGDLLGYVKDHFGEPIQTVTAPIDGIVSMRRCFYSVKKDELLLVLSALA